MADEYADDFEEYQDDFEEDEGVGINLSARVASSAPPTTLTAARTPTAAALPSVATAAAQTIVTGSALLPSMSKFGTKKHLEGLHLECEPFEELYADAPSSGYERYQGRLKLGVVKQTSTQVVEKRIEISTQCEAADVCDAGAQVPEDLGLSRAEVGTSGGTASGKSAPQPEISKRGVAFVQQAGQVCEKLCEENLLNLDNAPHVSARPTTLVASITVTSPLAEPLLANRAALCSALSPVRSTDIITAWSSQSAQPANAIIDKKYSNASLLCLGTVNADKESKLRFVLLCYGTPTVVTSSADGEFVVAGTAEGSIHMWSLSEPSYVHQTVYGHHTVTTGTKESRQSLCIANGLRFPSYTTNNPSFSLSESAPDSWSVLSKHGAALRCLCRVNTTSVLYRGFADILHADAVLDTVEEAEKVDSADSNGYADDFEGDGLPAAGVNRPPKKKTSRRLITAALPSAGSGIKTLLQRGESYKDGDGTTAGASATLQFISIDDYGRLDVWVVVSSSVNRNGEQHMALSSMVDSSDLGKSVTSTSKLAKISSAQTLNPPSNAHRTKTMHTAAMDASICPTDPTKILLACSDGKVRFVSRSGEAPVPGIFYPPNDFEMKAVFDDEVPVVLANAPATCLQFNPYLSEFFVVGYSNGDVALFTTAHALALRFWKSPWSAPPVTRGMQQHGNGVARVCWVPTRPAAFVAVDEYGCLAIWDLSVSLQAPVHVQQLSSSWGGASSSASPVQSVVAVDISGGTELSPRSVSLLCTFSNGNSVIVPLHATFVIPRMGEVAAARAAFMST